MSHTTVHRSPIRAVASAALLAMLALGLPSSDASSLAAPALSSVWSHPAAPAAATAVDPALSAALANGNTARAIVQLGAADPTRVRDAVASTGGTVTADLPIVDGLAATITAATIQALEQLGVQAVSLDGKVTLAHGSVDEPVSPDTTVDRTIRATKLYRSKIDGKGVGIAMIDTGANAVGDLVGRISGGVDLTADADGVDRYGHGTFVAGVAAGSEYGIAPGAHIVPVKIAGADGSSDVSHVLAALQWVVSFRDLHDIDVVNLSLGTDSTQHWTIDPLNYAVQRAWEAGIVVVVSSSNLGPEAGTVTKPADDPWVIAVGATDGEGTTDRADDTVTSFSGRGPTVSAGIAKPDLVAPGAHLLGTRAPGSTIDVENPEARYGTGHLQGSGTSFSAAVVTGAVALLRQAHPTWTPDQIKGALLSSAAPGPVGDVNVDGQGALDVLAAWQLTDPAPANQGLARSDGSGTLAASRGTLEVGITDTTEQVVETITCTEETTSGGLLTGLITTLVCVTEETIETTTTLLAVLDDTTNLTAQNQEFDAGAFLDDPWTAASWTASQWAGHRWYGTDWYGHRWYGHRWYGHRWY